MGNFNEIAFFETISNFLWNKWLLWVLLGTGLFFTIRLGFVQFCYWPEMLKTFSKSRNNKEGGISSFQALCTTMASRVGTGNLVGIATALYSGGPGAIFWMWMTAFVGMATGFSENVLAQIFKVKTADGHFRGGPAYYMQRGLGKRWMGILFSLLLILAFGLVFNAVQCNSITNALNYNFGFNKLHVGIGIAILAAITSFGGFKNIARIAEFTMPFVATSYILFAGYVVVTNFNLVPGVLKLIITSAFDFKSVAGGTLGYTMGEAFRYGVARGLFSNEAGMGSTPNASATANVKHPVDQGFVEMLGVFLDTMFVCTSTAAIILLSGVYQGKDSLMGIGLTQDATNAIIGPLGSYFLTGAIFLFAFTTIFANYFYAEMNLRFIFRHPKISLIVFRLLYLGMIVFGAINSISLMWTMADIANALMTTVNLIAILLLRKYVVNALNDYNQQKLLGKTPVFDYNYTHIHPSNNELPCLKTSVAKCSNEVQ